MIYQQYQDIDRLIEEYNEDNNNIRINRLVMINYPKVLVMSVASSFERRIKNSCSNCINKQKNTPNSYPLITKLVNNSKKNKYKTPADQMFAKLVGSNKYSNGKPNMDATGFYALFGGFNFRASVEIIYNNEKSKFISRLDELITRLDSLIHINSNNQKYYLDYVGYKELKDDLNKCSFDESEKSYLLLKLKRNNVAHDYIYGLSDSFEDLVHLYYKAVLYVVSLEAAIDNI